MSPSYLYANCMGTILQEPEAAMGWCRRARETYSPYEKFSMDMRINQSAKASLKPQLYPNFVFILTDDQDLEMNSLVPMKHLNSIMMEEGATFLNAYVSSPLCCPSRASILTGKYVHNHRTLNNSLLGGCSSHQWQAGPERRTFAHYLHKQNYTTFFAGKYLNQYGVKDSGGLSHIPPGWDWWIGLMGNSRYYNYTLSVNGTAEEHGDNPDQDYLTNVIKRKALEFLDLQSTFKPFFMMLCVPASHAPFTPEPKYSHNLSSFRIPQGKNFNIRNDISKHWLLRLGIQPLSDNVINKIEKVYRDRLRTLLSVDDMIEEVFRRLKNRKLLNNTYLLFTSDNGYHLGQFSLPLDKRQPYEFDIRVPLMIRGPGIGHGLKLQYPASNVDIMPTILDLAGIDYASLTDGVSLKCPLFSAKPDSTSVDKDGCSFKRSVLIEHSGEGHLVNNGCEFLGTGLYGCSPEYSCKCSDSWNNTYACIRSFGNDTNDVYCRWDDSVLFEEFYELDSDMYQLNNTINYRSSSDRKMLLKRLKKLRKCRGKSCQNDGKVS